MANKKEKLDSLTIKPAVKGFTVEVCYKTVEKKSKFDYNYRDETHIFADMSDLHDFIDDTL